jgi:hypothetical protein
MLRVAGPMRTFPEAGTRPRMPSPPRLATGTRPAGRSSRTRSPSPMPNAATCWPGPRHRKRATSHPTHSRSAGPADRPPVTAALHVIRRKCRCRSQRTAVDSQPRPCRLWGPHSCRPRQLAGPAGVMAAGTRMERTRWRRRGQGWPHEPGVQAQVTGWRRDVAGPPALQPGRGRVRFSAQVTE